MVSSKGKFTFTAPLPTFILLNNTQEQSPVVEFAFYECDLPFNGQWLLYVQSVLTLKFLPSYISRFR